VVDGLLTHLAVADSCTDDADGFTSKQIDTFLGIAERIKSIGFTIPYLHLSNSAAIIRKLHPCFNLVRPGLMLYGINPSPQVPVDLKPVMSLKTKIIALKTIPPHTSISYRRTFISTRESKIATLPIGYADGYSRHFSNKSAVIIRGHRAPVVGVVCMDMTMVDVTDIPEVKLSDEVILIGTQGQESIGTVELAEIANTIPYEIMCSISSRVQRAYIK
jgi:alanine racemase